MPLIIPSFGWREKEFSDESEFSGFQKRVFDTLPASQRENYVKIYRQTFHTTAEGAEFHTGVYLYSFLVEKYVDMVTSTGTRDVLSEEVTLLQQRLSRLVRLLTWESKLDHVLTLPTLYETYVSMHDLHEAFHEKRNVDASSPIHGKLHPVLIAWEMVTYLPWIRELAQSGEIKTPAKTSGGIVIPSRTAVGISPRPTTDLAKVQNLPWWPQGWNGHTPDITRGKWSAK